MKDTNQLMNELIKAHSLGDYLKENSAYMISDELPVYLTNILKKKGGLYMEDTRARIKTVIAAEQTTLKDVVNIMNERHPDDTTTPQNVTNKLARKTIRFDEVSEMMDIMNYDIIFRNRTTGKEF